MVQSFTKKLNGQEVTLHLLKNKKGTEVLITNYGARVVSWIYNGVDIVVGFNSLDGYLSSTEFYYGATIGRYANRIANGKFILNGKEYNVEINTPPHQLHGGTFGFHNRVWTIENAADNKITLFYFSKDGEEGYPGNLKVTVTYTLSDENELIINYEASTDKTTIINLTNHCYFNLNGQGNGSIVDHLLQINADNTTPVDKTLIPLGSLAPVENTPFDFRKLTRIGDRIDDDNEQLSFGKGYDHNFALNIEKGKVFFAAKAIGDKSGIVLETFTDQPGIQLYTGNSMSGKNKIKGEHTDGPRTAFCLETQHFPDSPNHPEFPSTVLQPEVKFMSATIYKLLSNNINWSL